MPSWEQIQFRAEQRKAAQETRNQRQAVRMHKKMKRQFKGIHSWHERQILFKVGQARMKNGK